VQEVTQAGNGDGMYELTIGVEDCSVVENVMVRAWIDCVMPGDLATETELALSKQGDCSWKANFCVPERSRAVFAYRVGLLAEAGASWSLRIRECGQTARTLIDDGDVFAMRKEWRLGTCHTQG
jgi:hypothetical protein